MIITTGRTISGIVHYQETTAGMCRENRPFILQETKVLQQVNFPDISPIIDRKGSPKKFNAVKSGG